MSQPPHQVPTCIGRQVETSWGAGGDLIKVRGREKERKKRGKKKRGRGEKRPASASTKRERKQRQDRTRLIIDARILKVEASLLLFLILTAE